jgi:hypothetical protein
MSHRRLPLLASGRPAGVSLSTRFQPPEFTEEPLHAETENAP